MSNLRPIALAVVWAMAGPGLAGEALGTLEEARTLADALIVIADTRGLPETVKAVYDPALPFSSSRMGINLFEGPVIVADNREPEMVAASYDQTADLTGELTWPRIMAAADREGDAVLKWYHYDTQAVYDYHCFSKRAADPRILVMICR